MGTLAHSEDTDKMTQNLVCLSLVEIFVDIFQVTYRRWLQPAKVFSTVENLGLCQEFLIH